MHPARRLLCMCLAHCRYPQNETGIEYKGLLDSAGLTSLVVICQHGLLAHAPLPGGFFLPLTVDSTVQACDGC
jgi:hypothetical protein